MGFKSEFGIIKNAEDSTAKDPGRIGADAVKLFNRMNVIVPVDEVFALMNTGMAADQRERLRIEKEADKLRFKRDK
jgi:hypothetical protein